jgi:hypothetical protein
LFYTREVFLMLKKVLKVIGVLLVVLATGAYFTYDFWLERELRYRLSEIINKDPNGLYQYSFSKLNIHLLDGSVELSGIVISPSEGAFDSLKSASSDLRFILQLTMDEIAMNGFDISKFIATGNISVTSIIISKPHFEYVYNPDKRDSKQAMPLSNIFNENFKVAELGKFLIENAEVKIIDQSKTHTTIIRDLNIELTNARMDSVTLKSFLPLEHESLLVNAAGLSIDAGKLLSIKSDSIFVIPNTRSFGLTNFQVNPKYSKENFTKMYDVQKQWFAIKLDTLIVNKINMNLFVTTGHVEVEKIEVISPNIALYKDKSKPPPPFKKKLLPVSAIRSIPWNLEVDSVSITNGYISIDETSPNTGKDSHLTFEKLSGLLLNFNNDQSLTNSSSTMSLKATTLVMGKASTRLNLNFALGSKVDPFTAHGSVGTVNATIFNPVLEPMMGVKIISGTFNSINFEFSANDNSSSGTLDADYLGLKIKILNIDSTKSKKEKKGFMSLAANTVVKAKNSTNGANYIQGIINTKRVQEKGVWPYLWHSVQSGLISTLAPITNSKENRQKQKKVRQELKKGKKGGR